VYFNDKLHHSKGEFIKVYQYSQHGGILWHFFFRTSFFGQFLPPPLGGICKMTTFLHDKMHEIYYILLLYTYYLK